MSKTIFNCSTLVMFGGPLLQKEKMRQYTSFITFSLQIETYLSKLHSIEKFGGNKEG